jgi:hypothetical protein
MEFFLRNGGIGLHALHGGIDFDPTLGSELFGIAFNKSGRSWKFIGRRGRPRCSINSRGATLP